MKSTFSYITSATKIQSYQSETVNTNMKRLKWISLLETEDYSNLFIHIWDNEMKFKVIMKVLEHYLYHKGMKWRFVKEFFINISKK